MLGRWLAVSDHSLPEYSEAVSVGRASHMKRRGADCCCAGFARCRAECYPVLPREERSSRCVARPMEVQVQHAGLRVVRLAPACQDALWPELQACRDARAASTDANSSAHPWAASAPTPGGRCGFKNESEGPPPPVSVFFCSVACTRVRAERQRSAHVRSVNEPMLPFWEESLLVPPPTSCLFP